jgi:hypothetical protein
MSAGRRAVETVIAHALVRMEHALAACKHRRGARYQGDSHRSLQNLSIAFVLMYAPYRALVALARLPQPVFSIPYNGNGWYSPIDCVGTECFDGESNAYLGRPVGLQAATAHTLGAGRLLVVVATDRRARTLVRVICDRLRINQQLSCNASIGFSPPKTTLPDWVRYRNASTNAESTCKSLQLRGSQSLRPRSRLDILAAAGRL